MAEKFTNARSSVFDFFIVLIIVFSEHVFRILDQILGKKIYTCGKQISKIINGAWCSYGLRLHGSYKGRKLKVKFILASDYPINRDGLKIYMKPLIPLPKKRILFMEIPRFYLMSTLYNGYLIRTHYPVKYFHWKDTQILEEDFIQELEGMSATCERLEQATKSSKFFELTGWKSLPF